MREDALILYWALLASVGLGGATYVALAWAHAQRGIRGAALLVTLACVSVIAASFSALHVRMGPVAAGWLVAVERALWWPLLFALLVLVDLYAADNNGHRAITTRLYLWWVALRERRG